VINTVTKSGTNEMHGNAYEIEQNRRVQCPQHVSPVRAPFKGHTFGGTAGGPVRFPRIYKRK